MNAGGVLLVIAGIWVLTQIWGGQALYRLKVLDSSSIPTPKAPA